MKLITTDLSQSPNRQKASKSNFQEGTGSPEGVVVGNMGDRYIDLNGGSGTTLYIKESEFETNTGWVAVGSSGWRGEEIFTATEGQTEFTVSAFTFTAGDKLTVLGNGLDQDEGAGFDWVRNVGLQKITFNDGQKAGRRVKIKQW